MPLQPEPDVSHAGWFTRSDDSWHQLCSLGPGGFARYGRLFHPLAPGVDDSDPDQLVNLEGDLDADVLAVLVDVLARHTTTPDDCFFCLWEGFGDIHGSPAVGVFTRGHRRRRQKALAIPPAFPPHVLHGPKVEIPARRYYLFRGPLRDAGDWAAAELVPGHPRPINSPNLMWPADRAWFTATDIDLPWTGVAGSEALLAELTAHPALDVEQVDPSGPVPYWRR